MSDYDDSILEKVKRLAQGQGLTEGGILKALAEAANELKRQDYQFGKTYGLQKRQIDIQEEAIRNAQEQQNIINWITGLSGMGAFGTPKVIENVYDPITGIKKEIRSTGGTPNWLQKLWGSTQGETAGSRWGLEQFFSSLFGGK